MSLWLTRIVPDRRSREARRDGTNAVDLHHRVMSLFPDDVADTTARQDLGVLFRTETASDGGHRILLQSSLPPDLNRLPPDYGPGTTKSLAPLLDAVRPGLAVRYRIAANPIRKPGRTTRELYNLSAVVPLRGAAADGWWTRQAENAGLQVTTLHSTPLDAARGARRSDQRPIKHDRVLFEGTAVITDADRLRSRLSDGIGKGKAYGCGLLSIAPHRGDQ
ncbi:type I-E CRISPR-associated protein Cas6/Cse3/CasE [Kitasatospora purpeofusca]|uniref:type I-E CRISPR-associated protein Cas6/Cse3/CasE n=1 Tax=Kitasatospora purpeofusca TaxID=67352 RepID=UPI0022547982|nr:type I-E CRISPR-associated protein Cas6/Cse3/CasE [Kitasatospora purpeofusca]MCX4690701.1 type I-E CRISPR-associated protein Cas6/Cse3/CasE [Kitasatospora purpeofusca]WSR45946.1 type I-E CRISPR-associated protein Cas6/Cse3/CasE [Kitasatospora purpeofusca]